MPPEGGHARSSRGNMWGYTLKGAAPQCQWISSWIKPLLSSALMADVSGLGFARDSLIRPLDSRGVEELASFQLHLKGNMKAMKTEKICIYCAAVLEKVLPRAVLCLIVLSACILNLSGVLYAQELGSAGPEKTIMAVRTDAPPKIDGILDDDTWQHAPATTGLTQCEPDEGKPATERTTIQIAYDDEAIYVAATCYDTKPNKVISRLYRRDEGLDGGQDFVEVCLDPHHDHQTGNFFIVTPSRVLRAYPKT